MKIINPSFELIDPPSYMSVLDKIEAAGRCCYKSEPKGNPEKFVRGIIKRGHESVIEHVSLTVKIVCDRGVTHELVRHRLCSFSQESTRYANYSKDKFGNEITVIRPCFLDEQSYEHDVWKDAVEYVEEAYMEMIDHYKMPPEQARSVLPNSLATTIFVTANLREWRHIFKLRRSPAAHPQIRQVMDIGYAEMVRRYPVFFDNLGGGE